MYRGVLAAAAAVFACVPAGAAVHVISLDFGRTYHGARLVDPPLEGVKAGDTIEVTFNFKNPASVTSQPFANGSMIAGFVIRKPSLEYVNLGPTVFELINPTGDLITSDIAPDTGPEMQHLRWLHVFQQGVTTGGTFDAVKLTYSVAVDVDQPITFAFFSTGVPEPASWALMIAGFGVAGAATRSRRRALRSMSH